MSTLRVNTLQNTSTTDGGISINNSGHVTVDGVAMPSAGPLSNRNLIINGAMQVAQRGTSVTGVSNGSNDGYQTLDRFALNFSFSPSGACTISQDTDVPSNEGFSNSYKLDVTTANTSIGSTQRILVEYKIEAQDVRNSGWNYTSASSDITLSFWAKSSKAGTYCLTARANDTGHKYYVFEYTLAANTWKKITHSIPGDSSLVFNNDTGNGLELQWTLAVGADKDNATANQWNATSSANAATSNQVNFFDSTDNNFWLTGVQLEVGSVATPFEHRSYGDELARCQRYFRRYCEGSSYKMSPCVFIGNTSTIAYGNMNLVPSMRAVPSSDFSSIRIDDQNSGQAVTSFSVSANSTNDSLYLTAQTASGLTQFRLYYIMANGTSSGRLDFSAEL